MEHITHLGRKRRMYQTSSSLSASRKATLKTSTCKNNIEDTPTPSALVENIKQTSQSTSLPHQKRPLVIIIAGPTGVGKSQTAFQLCQPSIANSILSAHCNENNTHQSTEQYSAKGHIISADSVQTYQGVTIGANKPTIQELEQYTHHLVDIVPSNGHYSAAEWREDALKVIDSITWKNGKELNKYENDINQSQCKNLPIIVGGTMMYLQWLVHGKPDALKPTPEAIEKAKILIEKYQAMDDNDDISTLNDTNDINNETSTTRINDEGWKRAMEETSKLGPIFKTRVEKFPGKDWYRLRRTLEVALTVLGDCIPMKNEIIPEQYQKNQKVLENVFTGERIDALTDLGYDVRCFFLCPNDRMRHAALLDERCEQMITRGLLKETADLSLSGDLPDDGLPAKAIGYRQALEYLKRKDAMPGDVDAFYGFLDGFTTATRQYSKKQMAWFRKDKEFIFIPVTLVKDESNNDDKTATLTDDERVKEVIDNITYMCRLSREEYENEIKSSDPNHISVKARTMNADQAKGMKLFQGKRYHLLKESDLLQKIIKEADECTMQMQDIENFGT